MDSRPAKLEFQQQALPLRLFVMQRVPDSPQSSRALARLIFYAAGDCHRTLFQKFLGKFPSVQMAIPIRSNDLRMLWMSLYRS
jgi:hypothetical protein